MDKKESLRDVAIRILGESPSPLRPERIAARAIISGALPPDAATIEMAMEGILGADVDRNGDRSEFVRASPGHYGINDRRPATAKGADSDPGMPTTRQLRAAAAAILRGSLGPLPTGMIASRAASEGMICPDLRMTAAILEETMKSEIAARGQESEFVRAASGHYGLRSHQAYDVHDVTQFVPKTPSSRPSHLPFSRISYELDAYPDPSAHDFEHDLALKGNVTPRLEKTSAGQPKARLKTMPKDDRRSHSEYTGRGSEHLVASMLLFHHLDVSMPIVDMGADLITTADDFTHNYIQVKTVVIKNNSYRFRIKIKSFMKYGKSNMFYVFVLRKGHPASSTTNCLVFSNTVLAEHIKQGHIQQRNKNLSIQFLQKGERFLLGSKKLDVSSHINNWDPLIAKTRRSKQATARS
ncbi:MAG: hypothetical protein OXD41_00280 [Thaumarchaeota archaeon]|nr:hypothetical protein [Nitrososphaerota archaeon]MDD9842632.1 hypothetical protein [Nitrososphaerota archaeon]